MPDANSVYRRGANDGFVMGVYLSVMFLLQAIGFRLTPLLLLGEIMMLGVPVVAYVLLRRAFIQDRGSSTFSALWMQGILIFLCGSLIMALVMYIYMRVVNPTFISDQFLLIVDTFTQAGTPDALAVADIAQRMIDERLLPTPISMAFSMLWFGSFSGAILSMILSVIVRLFRIRKVTD